VVGEEVGFVGGVLVVLFFLIVFARGIRIARHSQDQTGRLLAAGLTAVLATQTFLNVGGVTKFVPLTGITLPFISHGGASLLTAFAALGLLLAISDTGTGPPRKASRPASSVRAGTRGQAKAPTKTPTETQTKPAPRRKHAPKRTPGNGDEGAAD
jgi:O-antigen ligase